MKRTSALILTAAMVFTLASCGVPKKQGTTEDHYRLTFSMHTPADTPIGNQFQAMFDDIEEKTNGHVEINLYGSGTLASSADVVDMVADGACDIGWVFTSFYYGQYPLTDVIAVPGQGVHSCVQGTRVLWDLWEQFPEMRDEWSDFKVLVMFPNPVNYVYTNTQVESLDDLKGLSVRSPSGGIAEVLGALGCNVISMAPNDIYDNLSKNNIQGYALEPTGVADYSLDEITKSIVDIQMFQAPFITIMNMETWNSLPPEYQAVFEEWSGVDASLKFAEMWDQTADQNMQELLATGCAVAELSQEDHNRFQQVADTYADSWADAYSTDTFDALAYFQACQEAYDKYAE